MFIEVMKRDQWHETDKSVIFFCYSLQAISQLPSVKEKLVLSNFTILANK